ncbi:MAG TPA: enoyl-CoA hydratase/isomerase family protein [Ilumatobacteraceae bacterium]|nr:enoyl-CoA hydratase/isomerase family protein [Ilumatobacteraceae bacterium]HRB01960.1 enoyl-CoA hydratase/isomerase family protein [Ilumatobacteraceae bacterium]
MSERSLLVERSDGIAVLTLNRPERANSLTGAMIAELDDAGRALAVDVETRVVVVVGAGRFFCAGVDLEEAIEASPWKPGVKLGFDLVPQPLIAAVNGHAMGGGCELALACDIRVMSGAAKIGLPEAKFGELPLGGATARLARIVGPSRAKLMIMTGESIDAVEALRIGLVDSVVEPDAVLQSALHIAEQIAANAPYAVQTAKFLIDRSTEGSLSDALALERRMVLSMASDDDKREARNAAALRSPVYAKLFRERHDRP